MQSSGAKNMFQFSQLPDLIGGWVPILLYTKLFYLIVWHVELIYAENITFIILYDY